MKATVTEDAAGLRWEIRDDGSEEYRKAVELTCFKPSAWMVKAPIGSILPLCHSRREAEDVAEKLTSESRIVPLYEYDEWSEIRRAGEAASREEGFKVMEAEITALHAENDRLRKALCGLAMQEATLAVCDGEVQVEIGPHFTSDERLAIEWAAVVARDQSQVAIHKTLRRVLENAE